MAKAAKAGKKKSSKKKEKRTITHGIVHIKSTFNNTMISITDQDGNVLASGSSGMQGFKGSRKSTPFAAQRAAEICAAAVKKMGMKEVDLRVRGPGSGRESAIRAIQAAGLDIKMIQDVTPLPHNGCRPKKRRRV